MNGEGEKLIDVVKHEDVREYMFRKIDQMVENKETERSFEMLHRTLETMTLMENARKEAGIYFGGNND